MDERWRALQSHLGAAREAADAGDRGRALDELSAALAIDPGFLAARLMRDQLSPERAPAQVIRVPQEKTDSIVNAPPLNPSAPVAPPPIVSEPGFARFEAKARSRRIEHRMQAARRAIAESSFSEAEAAIDEVRALDPTMAMLPSLVDELQTARRRTIAPPRFSEVEPAMDEFRALDRTMAMPPSLVDEPQTARRSRGRRTLALMAAVVAFGVTIFGAAWRLQEPQRL